MTVHRLLFICLLAAHGGLLAAMPKQLAPLLAGSIYLPLLPLQEIGIPVMLAPQSGGWAAPAPLGWTLVLIFWPLVWWWMARCLSVIAKKCTGESGR